MRKTTGVSAGVGVGGGGRLRAARTRERIAYIVLDAASAAPPTQPGEGGCLAQKLIATVIATVPLEGVSRSASPERWTGIAHFKVILGSVKF